MGFLSAFNNTKPTAEIPQPPPSVAVPTVPTKKGNVGNKNKTTKNVYQLKTGHLLVSTG